MKITDVHQLVDLLREDAVGQSILLVAVDGLPASGKTWLSARLASAIPARHVKLDDFLEKDRGSYVDHLHLDFLKEKLRREATRDGVILIDGVCTADVFNRISVKPDRRVYVMRLDARGEWFDGEALTTGTSEEEAIASEEALANVAGVALPALAREVIHYHFAFHPQDRADYIYVHSDA